jgi:hypothetical protein
MVLLLVEKKEGGDEGGLEALVLWLGVWGRGGRGEWVIA